MHKVFKKDLKDYGNIKYSRDILGRNLALFLFSREALDATGLQTPRLYGRLGSATPLFVFDQGFHQSRRRGDAHNRKKKLIADAFGLPVRWVKGEAHSPYLPHGLVEVADQVCNKTKNKGWGLFLDEPLAEYDLSEISVEAPSAWTSLSAALELAVLGGMPRTGVFATGCWEEGLGVGQVEGIKEKVDAVCRLAAGYSARKQSLKQQGGHEEEESLHKSGSGEVNKSAETDSSEGEIETGASVPILFVPAGNFQEAKAAAAKRRIRIISYPPEQPKWKFALTEHLRALDVPPNRTTHSLEERLRYINRPYIRNDYRTRRDYYMKHVLHDLVREKKGSTSRAEPEVLSGSPRTEAPEPLKIERLILMLSFSYDLAAFVLASLEPTRAMLLFTSETEKYLDKVKDSAGEETSIEWKIVNPGEERAAFIECMNWLKEEPRKTGRAVDITGGTKLITAALLHASIGAEALCFYVTHDYKDGQPVCGKESLKVFPWLSSQSALEAAEPAGEEQRKSS